ncbi:MULTISPECIES: sugar phosphate nucleotidyltransferase [Clostridium]|uniref:Mannose-1-phosphate guanyltransferase (Pyrophosphorylase domain and phosphomannomutase domain) n=2 Tax=Clostridium novyi TaxID=1542 RepID=A0Q1V6_CLONN|nr:MULTISPECIES: sugar phosphate nucleotidyltransferase [Clostridium]ABK61896.1 mannose-1-phosphate guanyltransferase (pyrophosphorylase domain and phosphomannomutase domain) [Clostridium novyi NT]KEH88036.1 glucose-1-phosphate nucleotidyltransferase [Clostridium novyi A str. NCTC 538]KEH93770.1 glucose-1-phosphate nucleotidyltransferase [Clostridium botulinum C/D str. It1]
MKAVIMAGGLGNRLRPLTCNIPKPMMPIVNKPAIQYIIELLKNSGIKDIAITLQYLADEIMSYFQDGSRFGVNIKYFIEDMPLGTGGSVKNAEEFLDDTFIVISGDALINLDLRKVVKYHKSKNAQVTIVTKKVNTPLEYGVVITDNEGRIIKFLEKPGWSEVFSDKVNTGVYVLEPDVLKYYDKNKQFDFSKDLFPLLLIKNKRIFSYTISEYWCDIGDFNEYHKCNLDLLNGIIKVKLDGKEREQNIWIGRNCEISPKAKIIPPVFIGDNTSIHSYAEVGPNTILGSNNIVCSNATIKRSITFTNCYIGNGCQIRGGMLGKNVKVKYKTSIFENAVVGDNTLIEDKVIVKPRVKIWPNKLINPGSILSSNYKWGNKYSKTIFNRNGVTGIINVDITPELVSKLSSIAASVLSKNKKIVVGCNDNTASSNMFKYSVITGLLSMGVKVYDLNVMPNNIIRHAVVDLKADGAIKINIDKDNPEKVSIIFLDKRGLEINKNLKRKIESNFNRENFRRVTAYKIKKVKYCEEQIYSNYIINILDRLDVENIAKQNYSIIISCRNKNIINIIKKISEKIHVKTIIYNKKYDLQEMKKFVLKNALDMGVYIDDQGENAIIIDEKGNVIKDERYKILKSFVMLKMGKFKTLVVPIKSSNAMGEIAQMFGVKFITTKIDRGEILNAYINNEKDLSILEVINEYLLTLDAMATIIFTLNLMAIYKIKLSKIIKVLPKYYNHKKQIYCPWNKKAEVMRKLVEKTKSNVMDIVEGIKIKYKDYWILILPDSSEPLFKIYIESMSKIESKKIHYHLKEKVEEILKEDK